MEITFRGYDFPDGGGILKFQMSNQCNCKEENFILKGYSHLIIKFIPSTCTIYPHITTKRKMRRSRQSLCARMENIASSSTEFHGKLCYVVLLVYNAVCVCYDIYMKGMNLCAVHVYKIDVTMTTDKRKLVSTQKVLYEGWFSCVFFRV